MSTANGSSEAALQTGPASTAADGPQGPFPVQNRNKRGPVACKRCRRAKTKCLHGGAPPCRNCAEAGLSAECVFPAKGTSYIDRAPARRPKKKDEDASEEETTTTSRKALHGSREGSFVHDSQSSVFRSEPVTPLAEWLDHDGRYRRDVLIPPPPLIEDAANIFFTRLNPCSFLHRATFINNIRDTRTQVEPMLILAMCALAIRFVPGLVDFCTANRWTTNYYVDTARRLVLEAVGEPSLEACQAAYLLGLSDWSSGNGKRSWMMQGIAIRMAFLLGLHLEETHTLPENPTSADITYAEEARRLFWTLYMNDSIISSGIHRPQSILPSEINIPLPVDEETFAFGSPAPPLFLAQTRHADHQVIARISMMACLVQSCELWGEATRWACDIRRHGTIPTDPSSEFAKYQSALPHWRMRQPPRLQYSRSNLAACLQRNMASTLVYIHCLNASAEIMIRRPYLPYIIRACAPDTASIGDLGAVSPWNPPPSRDFWVQCGHDMVMAALRILDMIFDLTSPSHGHHPASNLSPHIGFHTFLATATLIYAWRWPWLCPERVYELPGLVHRATNVLEELEPNWPMARKWVDSLRAPPSEPIDEAVRADVAGDAQEGVIAHSSLDGPLAVRSRTATPTASPASVQAQAQAQQQQQQQQQPQQPQQQQQKPHPMPPLPVQHLPPSTHASVPPMNAASMFSVQHPAWSQPPQPPTDALHTLALAAAERPHPPQQAYAAQPPMVQYVDMPFGDPTQPQSFHDVLAYMNGDSPWGR